MGYILAKMIYRVDSLNPSLGVSDRGRGGFTLIELSVVVFLLAVFLLIAIPKFQDMTELSAKSASRTLTILVRQLYNEAVFKNRAYKLAFDIGEGYYWVEVLNGDEFIPSPNPSLKRKRLPDGVHFRDVITQRTYGRGLGLREEYILFFPTGFVEPAVIYLESENGQVYTLETLPYTGGVRVYDEFVVPLRNGSRRGI